MNVHVHVDIHTCIHVMIHLVYILYLCKTITNTLSHAEIDTMYLFLLSNMSTYALCILIHIEKVLSFNIMSPLLVYDAIGYVL